MIKKITINHYLFFTVFLAFALRIYGINWDNGFYFHPDERAIILFSLPLDFPASLSEFLSPASPLNPHFFAYGNFPLYLLKIISSFFAYFFDPAFATYAKTYVIGRTLSIVFDIATIIFIYKIGKDIFTKAIGVLGAFFYTISVLPIQLAHFYAVDTMLTFFTTAILYLLVLFYKNPSVYRAMHIGVLFGLALATKNSALVLIISILSALSTDFLLLLYKNSRSSLSFSPFVRKLFKELILYGIPFALLACVIVFVVEPYAFISFSEFLTQTMQQYQMTHNAFTFPYTLQYVGKTPYFYELKNLFFWGQGPLLALLCMGGIIWGSYTAFKKNKPVQIILLLFFWAYFIVVGKFAIGFMRYTLPLYPIFSLFGGALSYLLVQKIKNERYRRYVLIVGTLGILMWPMSFFHIYTQPSTRLVATDWILKNIPHGSTIAVEHWDDLLPVYDSQKYSFNILELYNPEGMQKWNTIAYQLSQSNYIIVASNRLYVPLQKLIDCDSLPPLYCYKETAQYYQDLFSEKRGFTKVAEFKSYPTIPLLNIPIVDDNADESFTVYDHPKIFIFQKKP